MKIEDLLQRIPHQFQAAEIAQLTRALKFAEAAHAGQTRKSGALYVTHPIEVAIILGQIFPDPSSLSAALLHDVPEDTQINLEDIEKAFGSKVAELVDGVTKLGKVRLAYSQSPQFLENLRKLFIATSKDVRVMLLKLADRLHNMRTLEFLPPEKQKRIALETLEVYAPIAGRLGIGAWQGELEDSAFRVVDPARWEYVKALHTELLHSSEKNFADTKQTLAKLLEEAAIPYTSISGRIKRIYSLHKKLQSKPHYTADPSLVNDVVAFRIITNSIQNCYAALGIIHQTFHPVTNKFDDYIALPKPNGYQSLHTTVLAGEGGHMEIQIRTDLMHEQAERGVAAHWFYSESGKKSQKVNADANWVQELRAWQEQDNNSEELLEALKLDLFQDRIFVLTPKGDVVNLPRGATPIDFAFSVHTEMGYFMTGSKVNGNIASIYSELHQGDIVEILKAKQKVKMSPDWLRAAKTRHARSRIRQYLAEQNR